MDTDIARFITILAFAVIGIIIAAIVYTMNAGGILIDEFITGTISITEVMTIIILVFTVCGVIVSALME